MTNHWIYIYVLYIQISIVLASIAHSKYGSSNEPSVYGKRLPMGLGGLEPGKVYSDRTVLRLFSRLGKLW